MERAHWTDKFRTLPFLKIMSCFKTDEVHANRTKPKSGMKLFVMFRRILPSITYRNSEIGQRELLKQTGELGQDYFTRPKQLEKTPTPGKL